MLLCVQGMVVIVIFYSISQHPLAFSVDHCTCHALPDILSNRTKVCIVCLFSPLIKYNIHLFWVLREILFCLHQIAFLSTVVLFVNSFLFDLQLQEH